MQEGRRLTQYELDKNVKKGGMGVKVAMEFDRQTEPNLPSLERVTAWDFHDKIDIQGHTEWLWEKRN